ncbi:MAG: iron donor protein CyaY [Polyangiaceae bacterium]|nr:iron donor protein CyaY [Polyangiaceae bacterium]
MSSSSLRVGLCGARPSTSPIRVSDFEKRADEALVALRSSLDDLGIDAEVELEMGILSIEFPDATKYIINSHRAAQQIWMAAERSAWHFDPRPDGTWVASKSGDELWSTIESVLGKKLGRAIQLSR